MWQPNQSDCKTYWQIDRAQVAAILELLARHSYFRVGVKLRRQAEADPMKEVVWQ